MSVHAVTCQSQHPVRMSLTPSLPQLIATAWFTANMWDFWRGLKFCHNIVDENSSLQGYENLLYCKQVPMFQKVLFLCSASSQNWVKWILASSCLSVCLFVRMEQLGLHWTDFHETLYLTIFRIPGEKFKFHYNLPSTTVPYMQAHIHIWQYLAEHFFECWVC